MKRLATESDNGSKERFDLTLDSNDPNQNFNPEIPSEHLATLQSIQTQHYQQAHLDSLKQLASGPSIGPKFAQLFSVPYPSHKSNKPAD